MEKMVIADLGETIDGWAAHVNSDLVCVASPKVFQDRSARRRVRNLVTAVGGNCAACRGCIIWRDDI